MNPNYWLVLSSCSFIAPAITCYYSKNYLLTYTYCLLTLISSLYHATKNPSLIFIDYSINHIVHILTLWNILKGREYSMPYYCICLSYIFTIYYYGYITKTLVWDYNLDTATPWHMSLHISTSATTSYTVWATFKYQQKLHGL